MSTYGSNSQLSFIKHKWSFRIQTQTVSSSRTTNRAVNRGEEIGFIQQLESSFTHGHQWWNATTVFSKMKTEEGVVTEIKVKPASVSYQNKPKAMNYNWKTWNSSVITWNLKPESKLTSNSKWIFKTLNLKIQNSYEVEASKLEN